MSRAQGSPTMPPVEIYTWVTLADRWLVDATTESARLKKVQRLARDLGVKPFTPPRRTPALIRSADVHRAEARGAKS